MDANKFILYTAFLDTLMKYIDKNSFKIWKYLLINLINFYLYLNNNI